MSKYEIEKKFKRKKIAIKRMKIILKKTNMKMDNFGLKC
jgi:hypothetical protein